MSGTEITKSKTLGMLLDDLRNIDPDAPYDPTTLGEVRDKIDAIKWRLDQWDAENEITQSWIKKLQARKKTTSNNAEGLRGYVKEKMLLDKYEKLPGVLCRVQLNNTKKLKFTCEPTAEIYLQYPDLIEQKTYYSWKKLEGEVYKKVKEMLPDFPYAKMEEGKSLNFYNSGDVINVEQLTNDPRSVGEIEAGTSEGDSEQLNA
jgi:hypothetical protein